MNELIKDLTIKALTTCDATKMTPLSSSVDNGDGVDIPLEFSTKFAELLLHDVLAQNILNARRVDKDPECENYPHEVIASFFYGDMLKRYGVE